MADDENSDESNEERRADLLRRAREEALRHLELASSRIARAPSLAISEHQSKVEQLQIAGLQQFVSLRGRWSLFLIIWITALVAFQILLTMMIGWGSLNFQAHPYFLPLVIGQNIVQIVGMGYVIVNFLYPKPLREQVAKTVASG